MITCHGYKKDGTVSQSPAMLDHGDSLAHPDRSPGTLAPERLTCWTRERLETAIAAHGVPDGLDLAGVDLSHLDLRGIDLRRAVFSRWDEESRSWIAAKLQGTGLLLANLQEADLRHANLQEADLWGADLRYADLQEADLWGADLREADLRHANLQRAWLVLDDLGGAKLQDANWQRANVVGANLPGM
jgi:uncharacterized protein YjbI with pentapeptide repeats